MTNSPTLPDGPHYPAHHYTDEELEAKCDEMLDILDIYSGCMAEMQDAIHKAREYLPCNARPELLAEIEQKEADLKAPRAYKDLRRRVMEMEVRLQNWKPTPRRDGRGGDTGPCPFFMLRDHDAAMKEAQDGE
jgi:hypothetical protein